MLIGITVDRRYRIDRRFSESSLGVVYRAHDLRDDQDVAIRTLHARFHAEAGMVAEFRQAAAEVARLRCDSTARVLGVVDSPGVIGFVTELLEGRTVDRLVAEEGRLAIWRALDIARHIALSLAEAHALGMVHRDLRARNVIVSGSGAKDHIKVLGYGLRSVRDRSSVNTQRTQGTPQYMSPEQLRRGDTQPAMDLYAVGVLLHQMLTGLLPFDDPDPMEIVRRKLAGPAPSLAELAPEVDAGVVRLVDSLLARDPAQRAPKTADLLAAELDGHITRIARGLPASGTRETPRPRDTTERPVAAGRRRSIGAVVIAASLVGLALGAAGAAYDIYAGEDESAPPPQALPEPSKRVIPPTASLMPATRPTPTVAPARSPATAPEPALPPAVKPAEPPAAAVKPTPPPAAEVKPAPPPKPAPPAPPGVVPVLQLGHRGTVRVAVVSRDGAWLATSGDDRTVLVADAATGKRLHTLDGLGASPAALAISADRKAVAAGGADGDLHVWTGDALETHRVRKLAGGVRALGFHVQGQLLVADQTRVLTRLSVEALAPVGIPLKLGRGGPAYAAALAGGGTLIAVVNSGVGRRLVPRDTLSGRVAFEVDAIPDVVRIAVDDTGGFIAAASGSGTIQVLDVRRGPESVRVIEHGRPLTALAMHPSLGVFASGGTDGSLALWDAATAMPRAWAGRGPKPGAAPVTALAFSPAAKTLRVAGAALETIDFDTGVVLATEAGLSPYGAPRTAFSANGSALASGGADGAVHVFDLATGRRTAHLARIGPLAALAFVEGDARLAAATLDGRLRVFDGEKEAWSLSGLGAITDMASDGRELVVAFGAGPARRFDAAGGRDLARPAGDSVTVARFAPAGGQLAWAGAGGAVGVVDAAAARTFEGGAAEATAVAWRDDGQAFAVAFEDATIRVYDLAGRATTVRGGGRALGLMLASDVVTAGGEDGAVVRWRLPDGRIEPAPSRTHTTGSLWAVSATTGVAARSTPEGVVRLLRFTPSPEERSSLFPGEGAWVAWTSAGPRSGDAPGLALLKLRSSGQVSAVASPPGNPEGPPN